MKYIGIKLYLYALLINLAPLILGSSGCSGESCMIILIAFGYWILWLISYIPYFLINAPIVKSKIEKIVVFYLPSILATFICLISNFEIIENNKSILLLLIVPNIILQSIFLVYYRYKADGKYYSIIEKLKKWNST